MSDPVGGRRSADAGITAERLAAYEVLRRTFEDGAWTDRAFAATTARHELSGRSLAQARRLTFGSVQRRGTLDHLIAGLSSRPLERIDGAVVAAIRLGLFELLYSDGPADHAAVDQAVELAKSGLRHDRAPAARTKAAAGFANALLRRAARERVELLGGLDDSTAERAAIAHSYPLWLAEMWWRELGAVEARLLMAAMNAPTETALRVNLLRADPAQVALQLREAGVEVNGPDVGGGDLLHPREAIIVDRVGDAVGARIATGEVLAQSRGSQAVIELLDPKPGERVLDLCAAPGIKTAAIGARMKGEGELVSVELDPRRADEVREVCARAGVDHVRIEVADAAEADLGDGYDRVLVDPPCSDLGTLGSRPDARWRKSPETVERLALLQRRLLTRATRALARRGTLVYSTCTISAHENEAVAIDLLQRADGLRADDLGAAHGRLASRRDRRFLQLLPQRDHTTGFFFARFRRSDG